MYSYDEVIQTAKEFFNGQELAADVWAKKYALVDNQGNYVEKSPDDTIRRIARELARIEAKKFKNPMTFEEIYETLKDFRRIIPQGSPLAGIGNYYQEISIANCFVLTTPEDSYGGIMNTDEEIVQISKRRGGCGIDLSKIRPAGFPTKNSSRTSTGIIPFMERYSSSIREVGQCIAKGQRVLTKDGLRAIEDVSAGDEVWTQDGWVRVKKLHHNGQKKVFNLTTNYGFSVVATNNHILLTGDGGALVEQHLEDFEVGDPIVVIPGTEFEKEYLDLDKAIYQQRNTRVYNPPPTLPKKLDENLSYLIGYSYANGYTEYDKFNEPFLLSFCIPNDRPLILEKVKTLIFDIFGYEPYSEPGDGDCTCIEICSKSICYFLQQNGLLKGKSDNLNFPTKIISSRSSVQGAFLSGVFDGDGSVSGGKTGYRLRLVDHEFIKQAQTLFMANGILGNFYTDPRDNHPNWKPLHALTVVGKYFQEKLISFLSESIKVQQKLHISKRDSVLTPYKAKSFEIKYNKFSYVPDNSQYLSANCYNKLKQDGVDLPNVVISDSVRSIEQAGIEDVYDLELESCHLFWCEGLYVHNSGRRGALLLTISVHHPQVLDFCTAKNDETKITGANISVRLTDEFMQAVRNDTEYEQRFPVEGTPKFKKSVRAREVWKAIIHNAWLRAEPGIFFWDMILRENPADCYAAFGFRTESCNPCGELNLSQLDACRLLLLNTFGYVRYPYTDKATFDYVAFRKDCMIAQRYMDNIVDLEEECIDRILSKIEKDPENDAIKSREYNLWKKIRQSCTDGRRTGTGLTALGDTLAALGIGYGTQLGIDTTELIYKTLKLACYRSSVDMAKELGPFPIWDNELEKDNPFLQRISEEDPDLAMDMLHYGRRNISILTQAPTGSISCIAKLITGYGTTSGIEPLFTDTPYRRRRKINHADDGVRIDFVDALGDKWQEYDVFPMGVEEWMRVNGSDDYTKSPYNKNTANDIDWKLRVKLQAAAQKHIDHSISTTVNLPNDVSEDKVAEIYETAWASNCKGMTVYRDNCRSGVLVRKGDEKPKDNTITKNQAPKRPTKLPCKLHNINVKGFKYNVIVGMMGEDPYEVYAIARESYLPLKEGFVVKKKRGHYQLQDEDGEIILENICEGINHEEEVTCRLLSTSLRHGADLSFIVHQIEKTEGDLFNFAKSIARALKKHLKDGTIVSGETCPGCGQDSLRRTEGCISCPCGFSKC